MVGRGEKELLMKVIGAFKLTLNQVASGDGGERKRRKERGKTQPGGL